MVNNVQSFEDLNIWKRSSSLAVKIYRDLKPINDFGFTNQIQRAVISISNNIAEGFERRSDKEFKQFLFISKGSCGEVRSMVHIGFELGYFDKKRYDEYIRETIAIARMIAGYIKSL